MIGNRLKGSFSRVKYQDISLRVGLDPVLKGRDIPNFPMSYALLPDTIFKSIVGDIMKISKQYGTMDKHQNAEARARYLASVCHQ
jgi:hypothetical protein